MNARAGRHVRGTPWGNAVKGPAARRAHEYNDADTNIRYVLVYRTGYELSDAEIREGYSRLGHAIDLPTRFYRHVAGLVAHSAPHGARVLDVGCGNGRLLEQLAKARPDLELYGFDVAAASVRAARQQDAGWHVVQASGLQLPFPSDSFDAVTMVEVVEHLKDPVGGLREAARLVRRTGRLLITVPNLSSWNPFWRLAEAVPIDVVRRIFLPSEHPLRTLQPIDTAYTYGELLELVRRAGLHVDAQHGRAYFPYMLATLQVMGGPGSTGGSVERSTESTLTRWHAELDRWLGHTLPPRLAYRLTLDCSRG